ncbi:hypothetical protein BASA50_007433 [Batrachochytrium salamandrivorans]|uniref:Homologous recombination OB-fold protein OB-fold domain-containing protein n=1 Tax=Batrachochytrium salamandrivorans TaxID=1357716 RepID=A0ABQ8F6R8_9FUNG|nr:hypothetical protein BASA50_007433 [Batrachochytrium salamandrivorans]
MFRGRLSQQQGAANPVPVQSQDSHRTLQHTTASSDPAEMAARSNPSTSYNVSDAPNFNSRKGFNPIHQQQLQSPLSAKSLWPSTVHTPFTQNNLLPHKQSHTSQIPLNNTTVSTSNEALRMQSPSVSLDQNLSHNQIPKYSHNSTPCDNRLLKTDTPQSFPPTDSYDFDDDFDDEMLKALGDAEENMPVIPATNPSTQKAISDTVHHPKTHTHILIQDTNQATSIQSQAPSTPSIHKNHQPYLSQTHAHTPIFTQQNQIQSSSLGRSGRSAVSIPESLNTPAQSKRMDSAHSLMSDPGPMKSQIASYQHASTDRVGSTPTPMGKFAFNQGSLGLNSTAGDPRQSSLSSSVSELIGQSPAHIAPSPTLQTNFLTPQRPFPQNSPASSILGSHLRSGKRKSTIPGPAGALMDMLEQQFPRENTQDTPSQRQGKRVRAHAESSAYDQDFHTMAWLNMRRVFTQYDAQTDGISAVLLTKNANVDSKIQLLVVLIHEIDKQDADAGALFKDPTGEIRGTIHRDVFEAFPDVLTPGAVLELNSVSIFKPTRRSKYLNVTVANIGSVFTFNGSPPRIWKSSTHSTNINHRVIRRGGDHQTG